MEAKFKMSDLGEANLFLQATRHEANADALCGGRAEEIRHGADQHAHSAALTFGKG